MPDGRSWPQVSLVTPNYNYGHFLEETLRSVLLQGYPSLEFLVIDGGSRDDSVKMIEKYAEWLTYWVSEPDDGQADAINRGFSRANGDLLNWINSDDLLLPGALGLLAEAYVRQPEDLLLGDVEDFVDGAADSWVVRQANVTFSHVVDRWNGHSSWQQPGMFIPRSLYQAVGGLDAGLRYVFDRDWLCRLTQRAAVCYLGVPVARFRIHAVAKTTAETPATLRECLLITQRYWDRAPGLNKRSIRAAYYMREAAVYLAAHAAYARFWNRSAGISRLMSACWSSPGLLFAPNFLTLCRRAALPRRLLRSTPW